MLAMSASDALGPEADGQVFTLIRHSGPANAVPSLQPVAQASIKAPLLRPTSQCMQNLALKRHPLQLGDSEKDHGWVPERKGAKSAGVHTAPSTPEFATPNGTTLLSGSGEPRAVFAWRHAEPAQKCTPQTLL